MICVICKAAKTEVLDTRNFFDPNEKFEYTERRRQCPACGEKFKTIEVEVSVFNADRTDAE